MNEASLAGGETDIDIDGVALTRYGTAAATAVPVGARFTVAGETGSPVHTVTGKTEASDITTNIEFTPALASAVADDAVITFAPIQVDIKVGEGNVSWSENSEYEIELERGDLETGTITDGDDQAMTVNLAFVFESYTTGTSEDTSPVDAFKGVGGASEWVTAGADDCEPYAVDLVIVHTPSCGTKQAETFVFPDFRRQTINPDLSAATMSVTGICKAVEPTVTRG